MGSTHSRIRLLLRTGLLLISVAVVAGCPGWNRGSGKVEVLANGCKRVTYANGVVADIRAKEIDEISYLMEHPYGSRLDNVYLVPPDGLNISLLDLFPLERNEPFDNGCRVYSSNNLRCWRIFDDGSQSLAFSVVFLKVHPERDRPRLMSEINQHLKQEVLNCD
jgi:hypothetical protein